MNRFTALTVLIFVVNVLTADLIDEAKTKIKSGDFVEANQYISTYLNSNPGDPRAYTFKCFSDIGLFFEDTFPNYLIDNFNANSSRTLDSFDYDETKQEIEPTEIQLISTDGMSSIIGYWVHYPEIKFPSKDPKDSYRYTSIFDMSIEPVNKSVFNLNNGFYYPTNDYSAISFTYTDVNPKQVNFEIDTYESGIIEIYLNGTEIGEIYDGSYKLYRNVRSDMYGSQIWGTLPGSIPLYLQNGDKLSFVSVPNYMGSSSSGPGMRPTDPYAFSPGPELGIAYNMTYPDLGNNITIDDIFAVFKRKDLPVRELLDKLISNLENFNIGDEVVIDSQFYLGESAETSIDPSTGSAILADTYDDIIIQYWDALALKSILGIIELYLSVSDQYDIGINYDYEELSGMDVYDSAKSFFSVFSNFLEANPSRIADQLSASTDFESTLSEFRYSFNTIWSRGDPVADNADFLIERSEYSDPGELADLNTSIDSLIQSIDGFDNFSNLTGETDGGFQYSLKPFIGQSPFALKQAIIDSEDLLDAEGDIPGNRQIELMEQYGLVKDLLPASFMGNVLAIYNSNGSLHKSILVSNDDDFNPFTGELDRLNNSGTGNDYIFGSDDNITLSYNEPFKGTWQNENYMTGTSTGTFYYYNDLLDMNSNGTIDRLDISNANNNPGGADGHTNISYPVPLTSNSISSAQSLFSTFLPDSLKGNLLVEKSTNSGMARDFVFFYYLTNSDAIMLDSGNNYSTHRYRYENGRDYYDPINNSDSFFSFIFNDEYSGIGIDNMMNDGPREFILYPGYIDLDNDGLADAEEVMLEIAPDIFTGSNYALPTSSEIQSAIAAYTPTEPVPHEEPTNPLALLDNDNDNMPDALEDKFGGNPNDGADAGNTLSVLLNNVYTLNQIRDLRPGSTMIEVADGYAQLGLTLQQSYDLYEWENMTTQVTVDPIQADSNTAYYRFKLQESGD